MTSVNPFIVEDLMKRLLIAATILAAGCDLSELLNHLSSNGYVEGPLWEIENLFPSHSRAEMGDLVTYSWSYTNDEPIVSQEVCFRVLYFPWESGLSEGVFEDCDIVDPDDRQITRTFDRPVTAFLYAQTEYGASEAAVEVKALEDAFLRATFENDGLPYLGQDLNPQTNGSLSTSIPRRSLTRRTERPRPSRRRRSSRRRTPSTR